MDWYDPAQRLALIESVGIKEYNKLHEEHMAKSTVEVVNGHGLRWVGSRYGNVCMVGKTGTGFQTLEAAREFALKTEPKP